MEPSTALERQAAAKAGARLELAPIGVARGGARDTPVAAGQAAASGRASRLRAAKRCRPPPGHGWGGIRLRGTRRRWPKTSIWTRPCCWSASRCRKVRAGTEGIVYAGRWNPIAETEAFAGSVFTNTDAPAAL
eukprot:scaffold582_cov385-Prasinococcus_capsulatus_cf.AAC.30